jgi:hypothetical protein
MSRPTHRDDIDALRAVAVGLVILFHFGVPGFSGGFVGVDVFFVISGFLIGGIIDRELSARQFSLIAFYERRVRRIFPALFAVLAVTAGVAALLLYPPDYERFGKSAGAAALFWSNIFFFNTAGYWAPRRPRSRCSTPGRWRWRSSSISSSRWCCSRSANGRCAGGWRRWRRWPWRRSARACGRCMRPRPRRSIWRRTGSGNS